MIPRERHWLKDTIINLYDFKIFKFPTSSNQEEGAMVIVIDSLWHAYTITKTQLNMKYGLWLLLNDCKLYRDCTSSEGLKLKLIIYVCISS